MGGGGAAFVGKRVLDLLLRLLRLQPLRQPRFDVGETAMKGAVC